jgi:hypothetical protein
MYVIRPKRTTGFKQESPGKISSYILPFTTTVAVFFRENFTSGVFGGYGIVSVKLPSPFQPEYIHIAAGRAGCIYGTANIPFEVS